MEHLEVREGGVYIDCTFGRGGHSRAILARLGDAGRLLAIDRDPEAAQAAAALGTRDGRVLAEHGRFSGLGDMVQSRGWEGRIDGVLFDLGVSSPQLDDPARGFSFSSDGPLDMRMDPRSGPSAAQWLSRAGRDEIASVLYTYGEERHARRVARAIVAAREIATIATTQRLAEVVAAATPRSAERRHPATRAFLALRLKINQELEELAAALPQALEVLGGGGRLLVIAFHSLEDRIVKRFLRDEARPSRPPRQFPVPAQEPPARLRLIAGPIRPPAAEVARNPRCRSAVLRVAERLG
ncbi:MAG: 16S rRNA (cytosine(1402)-N(4))-methyltransferase RsmH [Gammaproteobacteria bacterium]|nr:16S rRNA (cytosine(1402)-N(4))-methyltransferase RsmH [Gammaproteobacteria bacterium]